MYFKRLEMQGFKSFVEPVVIDFNTGVTCVVGPNGSGKSNLSDAIRWVLGEQSAKSIRAGKMEDIIFSGTATRKPRGMAEVTLVIDNEDGSLPIDYSEVSITRRLYRSGESEYLINNNPSRLKDIKELIMDTGIGVDGYSIISQGKITDLVESKPEARREVFEEAAGVVLYKTKKQEAERKLSATQVNLDRANDIVNEIESRIDTLKEDSEKAKEYLELRDRRKDLEINITLRNVEKYTESNEQGKNDVMDLTNRIEAAKFEQTRLDIRVGEMRERFDTLDTLSSDARDSLLETVEAINEITSQNQVDNEKLTAINNDIERLNGELAELRSDLESELGFSEDKEKARYDLEKQMDDANTALQEALQLYTSASAKSIEISQSIEDSKQEMLELSRLAVEKRGDVKSYEQYKETLLKQKENLLQEEKESENSNSDMLKAIENAESELKTNENAIAENSNDQTKKRTEINESVFLLREKKTELEDMKIRFGTLKSRKKTIEEMESNYDGYNNGVRFIMKQNLSGIYGVVAELIKSPVGYETAIETALGAAMQNIVCEKDADAKKAIGLLKTNSAGRLTFLPVESVKGKKSAVNPAIEKSRGYLGIASDLVEYDEKFTGVMSYLLGRTVIVTDMDTAVSLSKVENSGLRYVTLDGEVITSAGSITGGKYRNQSANLLSRKNEIEKLEQDISTLEDSIRTLSDEVSERENRNTDLSNELAALVNAERELKIVAANINARLESLKGNSEEALNAKEKRERALKNIEDDFINADSLIADALREAEAFELSVKGIEAEVAVRNIDYDNSRNDVAAANDNVTDKRIALNSLDKEMEKLESLLQINLDNIDDLTEKIDGKEEELEKAEEKKQKMVYGNTGSEDTLLSLEAEKTRLNEYIKEVDDEKAALSKELDAVVKEQSANTTKLNGMIADKEEYNIKLAKNETQLDMQKNKLLEEFEISYAQALTYRKEDFVLSTAVKEARDIRYRMDELGDVNVGAIAEYEQVSERYKFLSEQRDDIIKAKDELLEIIGNIDKTIRVRFKDNFDKVAENFESTFKELFGGGEAELTLVDENNPLESGIDINVQPPGKKIQNIDAFSGGEKTMIGLALMMAVLKTKPTPFCILDEVEAALDDANVERFARYLKNFSEETQFIVITHKKVTMELSDA
ncbi:MAG: chromosome segregation protein SMC, partial [Clostridia bacterium]|nr:chromosome segregation protein SMC [Clostridia bacterium]